MQNDHPSSDSPDGYEAFFGLAESPFRLTSNPRFLFESASYLAALTEIGYALTRREPIIAVVGPIGTGKTTLCRMIEERRGPRAVVAVVSSPPKTSDDLLRQVLDAFGLLTDDTRRIVEASRYGLLRVVQQFLDSLVALDAQAILVFDEAHQLPPEILEEIRLLLNLNTDRQQLQIVLIGQPELETLLGRAELAQLAQRISRWHRLEPLQLSEVAAYIERRLRVARSEPSADGPLTFTPPAMEAIATLSRGVPRVINIICDRSLENAWADKTHPVDKPAVVRAARSLNIDVPAFLAAPLHAPPPPVAPVVPAPIVTHGVTVPAPVAASVASVAPPAASRSVVEPPLSMSSPSAPPPSTTTASAMMRSASPPSATRLGSETAAGHGGGATLRLKRLHLPIAAAAAIAAVAIVGWMILGRSTGAPNAGAASAPGTARDTERRGPPVKVAPNEAASPAVPAAAPRPAATTPSPAQPTAPEKLLIVVSSFRTRDRANQVAENIVGLGLPATVRSLPGWEQVVVGPYGSRQDAIAAQGRLTAAHFADTKITSTNPAPAR